MAIDYNRPNRNQPTPAPAPSQPTSPGQVPDGVPVSLSKVTLTKSSPTVSLTKQGGARGTMRINLNWNARPSGAGGAGGFFKRAMGGSGARGAGGAVDLDLGCFYEFTDGTKSVVQALGNSFRDKNPRDAIIWLDGDDRSGTNSAGENLFINLDRVNEIRRVLVFAYIYEGVPNWAAADGVVTLYPTSGPQVEVRLDEHTPGKGMCGIALLENTTGDLSVRREVRYVGGHRDLDDAYGWGMRWTTGRK
jgi:tellurite resistance protein TerA